MAYPLIIFGLILVIVGWRGEIERFNALLRDDLTGSNNFVYWIVAVFFIGALSSYKPLRPVADGFFLLIIVALLLSNRGFFVKLQEQLR